MDDRNMYQKKKNVFYLIRDPDVWPAPPPKDPDVWSGPTHAQQPEPGRVRPVRGPKKAETGNSGKSGRTSRTSASSGKKTGGGIATYGQVKMFGFLKIDRLLYLKYQILCCCMKNTDIIFFFLQFI